MKDVNDKLYSAIFTLLSGNVSYDGNQIPVYSVVPQDVQNDYIYIADNNINEDETKDRFIQNGYINIQVVTRYDHGGFSDKKLNSVAAQVKDLLKATKTAVLDLSPDFNCTVWYLENDLKDYSLEQVEHASRRVLRYRFETEQIT